MTNTVIAAQLYTLREFLQTPEDIAQSLKKVKKIGYDVVQLSGLGPISPEKLKEILDKEELSVCATHISFDRMVNDTEAVIREHKLWNCKYAGVGSMPGEYRTSREGYVKFAKEASGIAKILNDNGLRFIYHNHNFEFRKFGRMTGLEILLKESDPAVFDFEIDTFWVQKGGSDAAAWIRSCKDRTAVVHLKDLAINSNIEQIMAEVGEGNLNWPSILEACREVGMEWYVVEQDTCQRSPFESLEISLNNLKKMGLK